MYKQCLDESFSKKIEQAKQRQRQDDMEQVKLHETLQSVKASQQECLDEIVSLEAWIEVVRSGLESWLTEIDLGGQRKVLVTVQK